MMSFKMPFDAVVVLSRSDWSTETASNSFHYIARFAKSLPVYFVQGYQIASENELVLKEDNLHVINPKFGYSEKTLEMVFSMIPRVNRSRILIWINSPLYCEALQYINIPSLMVYHVCEEYMESDFSLRDEAGHSPELVDLVKKTIKKCSLIVSESQEIIKILKESLNTLTPVLTLSDAHDSSSLKSLTKQKREKIYEERFEILIENLREIKVSKNFLNQERKKNILIIYSKASCHVGTVEEHLNAFGFFSRHHVTFVDGIEEKPIDENSLASFDAVVIHYSIRVSVENYISSEFYSSISKYHGLKVLLIQDDYDNLPSTYRHIEELKVDVIFTVVAPEYINFVYPKERFPNVKFIYNLTGYVSYNSLNFVIPQIEQRSTHVFYRGRKLPLYYGTLGLEKYMIGVKFKKNALQNNSGLMLDVESDNDHRIYGNEYYNRLVSSKAMLGTESGSNVFDFNGDLQDKIETDLGNGFSEDEIFDRHLTKLEKGVKVNMISPKMFEAISLKTALVLYEGEYSGVLIPNRHYIPLKKDFSNFTEIVSKLNDDHFLQDMVDRAYEEICMNDNLSYKYFIRNVFDSIIDDEVCILKPKEHAQAFGYFEKVISIKNLFVTTYHVKSSQLLRTPTVTFQESYDYNSPIENDRLLEFELKRISRIFLLKVIAFFPKKLIKLLLRLATLMKGLKTSILKLNVFLFKVIRRLKRIVWR